MLAVPKTVSAAENGALLTLLQELVERLTEQKALLQKKESTTTPATSASTQSSVPGLSSEELADTSCAKGDKPSSFSANKALFREKIRHLDVMAIISAKVNIRIYDTETIVKSTMQGKKDIFKLSETSKDKIIEKVLDRYGFSKAIRKTMDALGFDVIDKAFSVRDCRTNAVAS